MDFYRDIICFQVSYLSLLQKIYLITCIKTNIKSSYIYYKNLIVWVKSIYYKLFLFYQFNSFNNERYCYNNINLYYKFQVLKSMFVLFIIRKSILKTIFDLTLANKKLSLKNLILLSLSNIEKVETIISQVCRVVPSIF